MSGVFGRVFGKSKEQSQASALASIDKLSEVSGSIQFMLIVLFRRYVSVIWLPLFCVALWDVHGCLALPVDCIRLVKLFTNDGWLCLYYFLTSLVQSFGCIKYVQVYFIIFMHASI